MKKICSIWRSTHLVIATAICLASCSDDAIQSSLDQHNNSTMMGCPNDLHIQFPIVETPILYTDLTNESNQVRNYELRLSANRTEAVLVDRFQGCIASLVSTKGMIEQFDIRGPSNPSERNQGPGYTPSRRYVYQAGRDGLTCQSSLDPSRVTENRFLSRLDPETRTAVYEIADRSGDPVCEIVIERDSFFVGLRSQVQVVIWEAVSGEIVK